MLRFIFPTSAPAIEKAATGQNLVLEQAMAKVVTGGAAQAMPLTLDSVRVEANLDVSLSTLLASKVSTDS